MRRIWVFPLLVLAIALSTARNASAASGGPCPSSTLSATGPDYTAAGGLCNVVITFNADSTVTTVITNPNPYDGSEDTLVGIVNNTSSTITSIHLSSATVDIFGFDADGACSSVYVASGPCGGFRFIDPGDYEGPNVNFSGIAGSLRSGDVNFSAGGIAPNGGTSWFSLEGIPSLDVVVGATAPEPTTFVLLGTGLLFIAGFRKLRK